MSMIFVIAGATGKQGNSVLRNLLESKLDFAELRCPTRNPDSEKAKALKALSPKVKLIKCDFSKEDDLKKLFRGAWGAFLNLDSFSPEIAAKETAIAKSAIKIAAEESVKFFIYSSLPDVKKISGGRFTVPHFTNKASAESTLAASGMRYVIIHPTFYLENLLTYFIPRPAGDGSFSIAIPMQTTTKVACASIADIGRVVKLILENDKKYDGKTIPLVQGIYSGPDFAAIVARFTGKDVRYMTMPSEIASSFLQPDQIEMFQYYDEFGFSGPKGDLSIAPEIAELLTDLEGCLKKANFKLE